ncbi:unnamed protein product [Caenorhabditis bovis]|uniref:Glycosyltransferase family 92 protein n=1 Tax=Caenorhabditis bovis TaxID=2654633 RepID=A0A8S1EG90_9PELO|nr:unnamed protein product [Caenorhabditis bovis]
MDPNSGLETNLTNSFITSAYYYETSKSLGKNAVALVLLMSKYTTSNLEDYKIQIVANKGDSFSSSIASLKKESTNPSKCEYVMMMAQTNLDVDNPDGIFIESKGSRVQIPFKTPRESVISRVVVCIAPQFLAEKWQTFLMHIHVVKRYQAHMHIYVTSMIQKYFEMLQVYEKLGYLTVDFWLRPKFDKTEIVASDPNSEVEWRNQAGAQTDCLLQYKEAADFIAFFDIDDILIPRNSYNYYEEFTKVYSSAPSYASIFYQKRNVLVEKVANARNFSFRGLFSTMDVKSDVEFGKTVVKTENYNSTWIHYTKQIPLTLRIHSLDNELMHIKDFLDRELNGTAEFRIPMVYNTTTEPLIRENDINFLENDFRKVHSSEEMKAIAGELNYQNWFGPIIFKCYNETFYHPWFVEGHRFDTICPNVDYCEIPQRDDIKCIHSDAKYISGRTMDPLTFHWAIEPFWEHEHEDVGACCWQAQVYSWAADCWQEHVGCSVQPHCLLSRRDVAYHEMLIIL